MSQTKVSVDELPSIKIGFIGCGQMGLAIAQAIAKKILNSRDQIITFDPSVERQSVATAEGFTVIQSVDQLSSCEIVVLCVKPTLAKEVCSAALDSLKGKLVISVMAGITVDALMQMTNNTCRICRVLTSLSASVCCASSAYTISSNCSTDDCKIIDKILESFGISVGEIADYCVDAALAITGSGPAFLCPVIEALADAGVSNGLPRNVALKLAAGMVEGTGRLLLSSHQHPGQLKDAVCSPGGMSIRGLEEIESGAVRSAFIKAINKACERAKQLS